jgi:DNA-binding IclR family transcriptional regulator
VLPGERLERFTPQTLASRASLDAALDEVRRQGFAENRDEWIAGLSVVAAPIFVRGTIRGALAVAVPSPRLDELGATRVAHQAQAAAARIGAALEGGSR